MNKLKLVSGLAIGLLLINLVLIGFQFFKKPPRHEGPRNEIIHRLAFDEQQVIQYDSLIRQHRQSIRTLDSEIALLKQTLYTQLKVETALIHKDSLIQALGQKQMEVENVQFAHFIDIHKLCKPDQEERFQKLTSDLHDLFPKGRMKAN